jgi:hypothetical protein
MQETDYRERAVLKLERNANQSESQRDHRSSSINNNCQPLHSSASHLPSSQYHTITIDKYLLDQIALCFGCNLKNSESIEICTIEKISSIFVDSKEGMNIIHRMQCIQQ